MERRVIKVVPTDQYLSIGWLLTTRCNYDCMYCPTMWHDTTSKIHSLDDLKQAWVSIYTKSKNQNLKYKIAFSGGEVTTNKNFLPFLSWLRENYNDRIFQILVTTNGSATFKYYRSLFEHVNNISFSVHSEHINEKTFFDMILKLKESIDPSNFIHVNIMNEHWNADRIPKYEAILKSKDISYNVNTIDYSFKTREYPIFKGKLNLDI